MGVYVTVGLSAKLEEREKVSVSGIFLFGKVLGQIIGTLVFDTPIPGYSLDKITLFLTEFTVDISQLFENNQYFPGSPRLRQEMIQRFRF